MDQFLKVAIIGLSGQSIFFKVDEFPKPGETIIASDYFLEPGGKGYNQASCLLKLGANAAYLTAIGEDRYAQVCYDYLDQDGANLYFKVIADKKTAVANILTNKNGENQVSVYPGASGSLNLDNLKEFEKEIINADILLLTNELQLEVLEQAIRIAKENNVFVILNPAPYNPKFKLYDLCDVVIPNEIEAKQMFGIDQDKDITNEAKNIRNAFYFKNNFKNVIITLGNKGCLLINSKEIHYVNPLKVNTVDTTGAGDVFNASFAFFYFQTKDIRKACEYANIAAAISTTKNYVLNSLPELNEILSYKKI